VGLLLALQAACGRKRMKTDRTMVDPQGQPYTNRNGKLQPTIPP
jgi:hypothetical protein